MVKFDLRRTGSGNESVEADDVLISRDRTRIRYIEAYSHKVVEEPIENFHAIDRRRISTGWPAFFADENIPLNYRRKD